MAWAASASRLARSVRGYFGEAVTYTPLGGAAVSIRGVFDEAAATVEIQAGVPVQSTAPALTVVLADLAAMPKQGDTFVRDSNGQAYEVRTVELAGRAMAKLLLLEVA